MQRHQVIAHEYRLGVSVKLLAITVFYTWIPTIEQKNKIFFKPNERWFSRALIKNFMELDFKLMLNGSEVRITFPYLTLCYRIQKHREDNTSSFRN